MGSMKETSPLYEKAEKNNAFGVSPARQNRRKRVLICQTYLMQN
jgi:hypothetical protein